MTPQTKKAVVTLGVLAAIGGAYYLYTDSKMVHASAIAMKSNLHLLNYDKNYLRAWHKAIVKKLPTFTLNGKNYSTDTGKTI